MDQDLQDLECWNAGIMECGDTHPLNPVQRPRLFLCGSLWPSVVHAFDFCLGVRLNDCAGDSETITISMTIAMRSPNPSTLRTGLG
jgi:hypothetical protein